VRVPPCNPPPPPAPPSVVTLGLELQIDNPPVLDYCAKRKDLGREQRRSAADGHLLAHVADLHAEVGTRYGADLQIDVLARVAVLKPGVSTRTSY
jgi:hypothetical protein